MTLNEYLDSTTQQCDCIEFDDDGKCECELEAEREQDRYIDYLIHSAKED